MTIFSKIITTSIILVSSFSAWATPPAQQTTVISSEDINWGYLNPLRGDQSPGAADLWGDRTKNTATGMLVKFNKGFSSPPHIHNISYRGIVIEGLMHNDDPTAENMWLPTASFWTQPAGENHITAANGNANLIYLEIDSGPYLVKPQEQHFDNGERPINVHASNLVWLTDKESSQIKGENLGITFLWKNSKIPSSQGYLLKLPAGSKVDITSNAAEFRAVVIQGDIRYQSSELNSAKGLRPGSYFNAKGDFTHNIITLKESILYINATDIFHVESKY
ncbi:DUF4437 domain-containing protein [Colwellia sp. E2M01]|uniref:DUF4437 domain-containing protein n=1 Tax=Colwellia sp. E2M01 TaxID=2841561 RepID=UPI001C08D75C|nr:DUF4437 domain-containing protein [Colwellia sp. E2M01]MBU2869133.1 DUF4437 domain-containing protein [Colwellia sp. E2M01]